MTDFDLKNHFQMQLKQFKSVGVLNDGELVQAMSVIRDMGIQNILVNMVGLNQYMIVVDETTKEQREAVILHLVEDGHKPRAISVFKIFFNCNTLVSARDGVMEL